MLFGNKNKEEKEKCDSCGSKVSMRYKFCPHCGVSFVNPKKEREDFGLLGKNDISESNAENNLFSGQGFGITDKLIGTVFNSLMKNLDKQMKNNMMNSNNDFGNAEIRSFPNGIGIKIFGPFDMQQQKPKRRERIVQKINNEQLKKMSELPREKAKTIVKRLGDKVVYELAAFGINSVEDIYVSKIETGYEIKAIGSKKVYVNTIPINLPLTKYSVSENKIMFEFVNGQGFQQGF